MGLYTSHSKEANHNKKQRSKEFCRSLRDTETSTKPKSKENLLGISRCHSSSYPEKDLFEKEQSRTDLLV